MRPLQRLKTASRAQRIPHARLRCQALRDTGLWRCYSRPARTPVAVDRGGQFLGECLPVVVMATGQSSSSNLRLAHRIHADLHLHRAGPVTTLLQRLVFRRTSNHISYLGLLAVFWVTQLPTRISPGMLRTSYQYALCQHEWSGHYGSKGFQRTFTGFDRGTG